jgi:hypothetical protein
MNRHDLMKKVLIRYDMGYTDTLHDAVDELQHMINLSEKTNLTFKECEELFLSFCSSVGRQDVS